MSAYKCPTCREYTRYHDDLCACDRADQYGENQDTIEELESQLTQRDALIKKLIKALEYIDNGAGTQPTDHASVIALAMQLNAKKALAHARRILDMPAKTLPAND